MSATFSNPTPHDPAIGPHLRRLNGHPPTRLSGNRQADRSHDPYYETFRDDGRYPGATTIERALETEALGGVRLPKSYRRRPLRIPEDFVAGGRLNLALNLLGLLCSFRVVTNNQAAGFLNEPALADPRSELVSQLFSSDLIALSSPYQGHSLGVAGAGTTAYQISSNKNIRHLLRGLTYAESLAVTGHRPLPTEPVHLRHDILCAELAIRASEYLRVGTVLGPHFSRFPDLTVGCPKPSSSKGGADLTIVRPDGLRIAVELTASIGKGFSEKVQHWVQVLSETPFACTGLVVVFLVAPSPARLRQDGHRVDRIVRSEVLRRVRMEPGSMGDPVGDRIGVARWQDWFPVAMTASDKFTRLTVDRPNAWRRVWEPCDVFDQASLPLVALEPEALRAVGANSALLGQTHWQLRRPYHPARLSAELLRGAVGEPQAAAPLREGSGTRRPGVGQGAAADAHIPARLIGPADLDGSGATQPILTPPPRPRVVARRKRPPTSPDTHVEGTSR